MAPDEQAVRDLIAAWIEASMAGDLATLLELMSDDVVFMVAGHEPFGKEAFAAAAETMKGVPMEATSDVRELKVIGDWAYARNFLQVRITPPGAETIRRQGYVLSLFRKEQDGSWRLARDANMLVKVG